MSKLTLLPQDTTKTETDRSNYLVEFTQSQNNISEIGIKDFNYVSLFGNAGNEVTTDSDANTFIMNAVDMNSDSAAPGLTRAFDAATFAIFTTTSSSSTLSNIQRLFN